MLHVFTLHFSGEQVVCGGLRGRSYQVSYHLSVRGDVTYSAFDWVKQTILVLSFRYAIAVSIIPLLFLA